MAPVRGAEQEGVLGFGKGLVKGEQAGTQAPTHRQAGRQTSKAGA